jgi:hypothetical protein
MDSIGRFHRPCCSVFQRASSMVIDITGLSSQFLLGCMALSQDATCVGARLH